MVASVRDRVGSSRAGSPPEALGVTRSYASYPGPFRMILKAGGRKEFRLPRVDRAPDRE
jgi:hypothetical protein